ncbi:Vps51/Vps67 protein [Trypanosoma grayi]|uniref:Vps51/Vps67 protein n=1 Tax=Trypanosoma grayi TaxID=71804 RepID=UPI0004F47289|nr:Vps51/Vps67 protein [Trypanosoma grayi]KEG09566.1 Vps51/Vps67 protein [Trypanosoma grayi]
MSAGSTERRQRIRAQLREFYGDPAAAREKRPVEGGKAGVPPELDLDSEFFNVSKYITDLLRRESLKGLVETDTQLLRTVRQLDGELQELVYRNYAKFISATDTIREMRDNVTEMDAKLQALSSNVDNIDQVSKGISEKLQAHCSRIEEMITTNRMLRKVQFLVDLADTMRRLIERREYGACAKHWIIGDSFFAKHAHLSSISKIHDECRGLARQLYNQLQETVCTASLDDPEAMDVIRCVVEDMRLLRATSLFPGEAEAGQKRKDGATTLSSFEADILKTLMKNVSASFTAGIQGVNSAIRSALAVPNFAAMERARWGDALQHAHLQEALAQLKSICALFYSNSERVYSLFKRESDATVSLRIVEEVQPVLIEVMTPITVHMSELLIAVVDAVGNDGEGAMQTPATVKNSIDGIFTALAKHLKYYAGTLKTLGVNYLDNAHSQQSRQYAALVDQSVLDIFQRLLTVLEAKVTEGPSEPVTIMCGGAATEAVYQQLLRFAITRFVFGSAATAADMVGITTLINTDTLMSVDAAGTRKRCNSVARALAHRGIVLLGQLHLRWVTASWCLVDAVDPTSSAAAQHHGVAPCLCELVQQLGVIYSVLQGGILAGGRSGGAPSKEGRSVDSIRGGSMHFTGGGSGRSSGRSGPTKLAVTFTRQSGDALQSSVERIFSKQSNINASVRTLPREIRSATVLGAVVVYLLKGIVEYVRQQTYTRNGFQCMQITCTFLLHVLTPPLASASFSAREETPVALLEEWMHDCNDDSLLRMVPLLLNECCTCAYERCHDKVPLTGVVVEKLVKSAIKAMRNSTLS